MGERILNKRAIIFLLTVMCAVVAYASTGASPASAVGGWPETPDDTWATNGTVFDTALSNDETTLYVAGSFTVVRENGPDGGGERVSRRNLAAINTTTGEVIRSWKPDVTGTSNPVVRAVEVQNGRVYFGGRFNNIDGEPRSNVAAVDGVDGSVEPGFSPEVAHSRADIEPEVFTILAGSTRVYIGGRFNRVDGEVRPQLAAFDLDTGQLNDGWKPGVTREVFDLQFASDKETIFVLGRFRSIVGSDGVTETRETVGRVYTDSGNVHPWALPAGIIETPQTAWVGLVTPDRLYAGFGDKGPNYAAAFRLDNGDTGDRIWKRNVVGDVYSLALTPDGKRLFFGGHFGTNRLRQGACGRPVQGIGALNPDNGNWLCDWLPPLQPEFNNGHGPWDMTMIGDDQLWVGGGFTHVSGVNQTNLARFTYGSVDKPRVDTNEPGVRDAGKPRISGVGPGGKIRDRTPTIRARVADSTSQLAARNIQLRVDGKRIKKFSYNTRTDRLTYTARRLSKGRHTVEIAAADAAGNKSVKRWKFWVTR